MINAFKVIVSGFVKNNQGQLLIIRRSDDEESFPGMLAIPGGTIEAEETGRLELNTVEDNLVREIQEETNVTVTVGAWLESTCMVKNGKGKLYMLFECALVEQQTTLETSDETPEVFWANLSDINLDECTPTLKKYVEEALGA
ncbi:MAG: NUDIX hydrolase [Candidatus Saccharimonadales bacterium]